MYTVGLAHAVSPVGDFAVAGLVMLLLGAVLAYGGNAAAPAVPRRSSR